VTKSCATALNRNFTYPPPLNDGHDPSPVSFYVRDLAWDTLVAPTNRRAIWPVVWLIWHQNGV